MSTEKGASYTEEGKSEKATSFFVGIMKLHRGRYYDACPYLLIRNDNTLNTDKI